MTDIQDVRDAIQQYDDGLISLHELGHKLLQAGQTIVDDAHEDGDVDGDEDVSGRDDQPDTVDELGPTL